MGDVVNSMLATFTFQALSLVKNLDLVDQKAQINFSNLSRWGGKAMTKIVNLEKLLTKKNRLFIALCFWYIHIRILVGATEIGHCTEILFD